jgi:hypothetical protein
MQNLITLISRGAVVLAHFVMNLVQWDLSLMPLISDDRQGNCCAPVDFLREETDERERGQGWIGRVYM